MPLSLNIARNTIPAIDRAAFDEFFSGRDFVDMTEVTAFRHACKKKRNQENQATIVSPVMSKPSPEKGISKANARNLVPLNVRALFDEHFSTYQRITMEEIEQFSHSHARNNSKKIPTGWKILTSSNGTIKYIHEISGTEQFEFPLQPNSLESQLYNKYLPECKVKYYVPGYTDPFGAVILSVQGEGVARRIFIRYTEPWEEYGEQWVKFSDVELIDRKSIDTLVKAGLASSAEEKKERAAAAKNLQLLKKIDADAKLEEEGEKKLADEDEKEIEKAKREIEDMKIKLKEQIRNRRKQKLRVMTRLLGKKSVKFEKKNLKRKVIPKEKVKMNEHKVKSIFTSGKTDAEKLQQASMNRMIKNQLLKSLAQRTISQNKGGWTSVLARTSQEKKESKVENRMIDPFALTCH
eukprot:g6122.t1